MKNPAQKACLLGLALNLTLFFVKLYIGLSTFSLTIYCDAVNNLGDTLACGVSVLGYFLIRRLGEKQTRRAESLCTFFISLLITVTGAYFIYNGIHRFFYPTPIAPFLKYEIILACTIAVKILMGFMYSYFDKKEPSSVLKALRLDSFLDCFITLAALFGLVLVKRVNYAVDGVFAVITGSVITVSAIKNIIKETKFLVLE
ncbi:MAG: cation transporter [Eubacterium sp.]|nr:cation transporter [Eubacterium sp.]